MSGALREWDGAKWIDLMVGDITTTTVEATVGAEVGSIIAWPHPTIPDGFLRCDGTAVSRTTYADLYALIQQGYGSGDGTTTFNLPDYRGSSLFGHDDNIVLPFGSIGGHVGGEASHTLTIAEMPVHPAYNVAGGGWANNAGAGPIGGNQGSGEAHNNLPPYSVVEWIIKAIKTSFSAMLSTEVSDAATSAESADTSAINAAVSAAEAVAAAEAIAAAPIAASISGPYAGRPAANAVPAATLYYGTDVPEVYRSNGSSWAVVDTGGAEIGYAEVTSMSSTASTSDVDVTGLTSTFLVGERPIAISLEAELANSSAGGTTKASIILDGGVVAYMVSSAVIASGWNQQSRSVRIAGLTPGSTHVAHVHFCTTTGGATAYIGGAPSSPSSLSVVIR